MGIRGIVKKAAKGVDRRVDSTRASAKGLASRAGAATKNRVVSDFKKMADNERRKNAVKRK